MPTEFILYACPTGPLAQQLEEYFQRAAADIGPNKAHAYMPHCTLTGFFHDQPAVVPLYLQALSQALTAVDRPPSPVVTIHQLSFTEKFHGFELSSPYLQAVTAAFAEQAPAATRSDVIRLKEWLHLSLAYGFPPHQHEALRRLATAVIEPDTAVSWELRFYERHLDNSWTCHKTWPL